MARPFRLRRPGIFGLTATEYLADPCLRPSLNRGTALKLIEPGSPAHAWTHHPRYGGQPDDTDDDTVDIGSAVHAAFLLDEDLIEEFPFSSWRSDAARARRAASKANGKIPLLSDKANAVRSIVEALYRFRQRTGAFTKGQAERTAVWREGEGGVWCRARIDWLPDALTAPLWDLKVTAGLATASAWRYRAAEVGADVQAVMYCRGVATIRKRAPDGMRFCVVEEKPPHGIRVFRYSGEALEIGQAKFDRAVALWRECQATDNWPNYSDDEVFLDAGYDARNDWSAFTATAQGLNGQKRREADASVAGKIVQQGNWGG